MKKQELKGERKGLAKKFAEKKAGMEAVQVQQWVTYIFKPV